jgi:hypothetical protein
MTSRIRRSSLYYYPYHLIWSRKCLIVCVIYLWEGQIWMKEFQECSCQVMVRVAIGKYYTFK